MRVIVEAGATKSEWKTDGGQGFVLPGMNVSSMQSDTVEVVLNQGISRCLSYGSQIESLSLYFAGIISDNIRTVISSFISSRLPKVKIEIQTDLVAAARAVFAGSGKNGKGIVAILGTGSNTCFFDGKTVSQNVNSGGFILGDEGSASSLGKLFLSDVLKNRVPSDILDDVSRSFDLSYGSIVSRVYHGESPSAYLGSLSPAILPHYSSSEYVRTLVDNNFRAFVEKSLLSYDTESFPVGVVGGFGFACRDILKRILAEYGISVSGFIPKPIDALSFSYEDSSCR